MVPREITRGRPPGDSSRLPERDHSDDPSGIRPAASSRAGSTRSTGRDLLRYRTLAKNLVYKDLKLKYRGSVVGVAWSLLNPLLLLAVYTVAFKHVLRVE